MNGTAVMTGLACLAWDRADYVARLATRLTACNVVRQRRQRPPFRRNAVRRQAACGPACAWRAACAPTCTSDRPAPQRAAACRTAIRCAARRTSSACWTTRLPLLRQLIENELNSANDNPLIEADERARAARRPLLRRPHRAGHGHARRTRWPTSPTCWTASSRCWWTPASTTACRPTCPAATGPRAAINHGLKALQISVSAWTAEALKQTMPASVFSRSTECHNQDKVSMGTIAARDCAARAGADRAGGRRPADRRPPGAWRCACP